MLRLHSRRQFLRRSAAFAAGACATPVIAGNTVGCFRDVEASGGVAAALGSGTIGAVREAICWSCSADRAAFHAQGQRVLGPVMFALGLEQPTSVLAAGTTSASDGFPSGMAVRYEFPAARDRRSLRVTWYDGEWAPPYESIDGVPLPEFGMLYLGSTGQLLDDPAAGRVLLLRDGQPPEELPAVAAAGAPRSVRNWLTAWTRRSHSPAGSDRTALVDQLVRAGLLAYEQGQALQRDISGTLA